jgi:alkylhydroperoxidase/carboxymuconolactone decarboxylase family protein YurZ
MTVSTNVSDVLIGIASHDPDAIEGAFKARAQSVEASGLDPRAYALANIAALIALDAPPASYLFQVGFALDAGVTPEEILGLLVALNPTVGNVRVVAAAAELALALDIDLDIQADES